MTRSASSSTACASPAARSDVPGRAAVASSSFANAWLSYDRLGPSSHSMLSASRPCQADQVLVAQTAIPPSCWNSGRPRYLGSGTISTTPGSLRASVASHDLTLPPTTGGRAITANSWFSRRASMAFPVTRSSRSTSGASLPIYFHFSRGFNVSGRQRELPESWQFRPARRIRYAGRHLCE